MPKVTASQGGERTTLPCPGLQGWFPCLSMPQGARWHAVRLLLRLYNHDTPGPEGHSGAVNPGFVISLLGRLKPGERKDFPLPGGRLQF